MAMRLLTDLHIRIKVKIAMHRATRRDRAIMGVAAGISQRMCRHNKRGNVTIAAIESPFKSVNSSNARIVGPTL